MTIEIDIHEIVLDGVPVADVASFRAGVAAALTRLARDHSGGWTAGEAPLLQGTAIAGPSPDAVAGSVWHAIVPDSAGGDTP